MTARDIHMSGTTESDDSMAGVLNQHVKTKQRRTWHGIKQMHDVKHPKHLFLIQTINPAWTAQEIFLKSN
jgi:hypothetical protein